MTAGDERARAAGRRGPILIAASRFPLTFVPAIAPFVGFSVFGLAVGSRYGPASYGVMAGACFAGLVFAVHALLYGTNRILADEEGLVVVRWGITRRACRWEDVRSAHWEEGFWELFTPLAFSGVRVWFKEGDHPSWEWTEGKLIGRIMPELPSVRLAVATNAETILRQYLGERLEEPRRPND